MKEYGNGIRFKKDCFHRSPAGNEHHARCPADACGQAATLGTRTDDPAPLRGAGQWQRFGLLCGSSDVHDEYMQLRNGVCRDAYHVATSTHQLILFSLYGNDIPSPKQDWIGLNELARTILSSYDLQPSLIDKNRKLAIEFRTTVPDDVMVNTSPLLYELLNCLLDNADKYATGGTVLMSCDADVDGTYAISVSNEGPVIPAADAERIFEPFVRLSADESSLGIELSLARRLALSMGCNIVLDTEYTEGARFVVTGI